MKGKPPTTKPTTRLPVLALLEKTATSMNALTIFEHLKSQGYSSTQKAVRGVLSRMIDDEVIGGIPIYNSRPGRPPFDYHILSRGKVELERRRREVQ